MSSITFNRDAKLHTSSAAPPQAGSDASVDGRSEKVRDVLEKLFLYLQANAPSHPGLAASITEMHSAVAAYQSGRLNDPFGPARKVVQLIEQQRKLDPSLPKP